MDEEIGQAAAQALKSVRAGSSVWTTLRFLSNLLFALCWIVALPIELLLNRRMGRRYSGFLPLCLSVTLVMTVLIFVSSGPSAFQAEAAKHLTLQPWFQRCCITLGIIGLAVFRHRAANWLRFRTEDQVHSFSCGFPIYLQLPFVNRLTPDQPTATPILATTTQDKKKARWKTLDTVMGDALLHLLGPELKHFLSEWIRGRVPSGPFLWYASTVLHPVLLGAGAIALLKVDAPVASYCGLAAGAIFLKARIQKAIIVESLYDLFDARIEQDFMRSLGEPQRLNTVEQRGFPVPGLARIISAPLGTNSAATPLAPEFASLLEGTASDSQQTGPSGLVEIKPAPPPGVGPTIAIDGFWSGFQSGWTGPHSGPPQSGRPR